MHFTLIPLETAERLEKQQQALFEKSQALEQKVMELLDLIKDKPLPNNLKPLLAPREVARRLSVSAPTVIRMIHDGQIKATRIGKKFFIAEAELINLLNNGKPRKR